jgi:hypothetical protein
MTGESKHYMYELIYFDMITMFIHVYTHTYIYIHRHLLVVSINGGIPIAEWFRLENPSIDG